jgi:putative DNA primase/helicase
VCFEQRLKLDLALRVGTAERLIERDEQRRAGLTAQSKAVLHLMACMSVTHGQAARVAKQLALIGTAGELATAAGITGWPAGSAADAVLDAYQLWQSEQGSGQTEDQQILESVRSFIERHGESRFAPRHATSAHPIRERAGYTEEDPATGQVTYLFLASGPREALSGQDLKRGLIALARAGWLVKGSGDKHRLQRKIQGKNTNVYAVSLPDDELDDADARQA